jgi:hypothetical protein
MLMAIAYFTVSFVSYSKVNFDKSAYYAAISSDNLKMVEEQLSLLKKSEIIEREGFEGALLMKKAGLIGNLMEKLSLFKEGHKKLEEAIKNDPDNTEFRFLRLVIQEHAPSILNYDNELKRDSIHIKKTFKSLPTSVQKVIIDYSKQSKVLLI